MAARLLIDLVAELRIGDGPVLASANSLTVTTNGRVIVGDQSDRALKVFGPDGLQVAPIGRAGAAPGEFTLLNSSGVLGDSVYGWDSRANRVTVFDPAGRYARAFAIGQPGSPRFARLRVMDDSLLVASGWVQGAHDQPLVEVFDRRGRRVGRMAQMKEAFSPPDPHLLPHTAVFADGRGGVVFSTVHGIDTIFAHTADGRMLGTGRIGLTGHAPVLDLRRLLRRNRGTLQRPDSSWVQDGHYAALGLVALSDDLVAVQFARLNFAENTDLLSDGGPVVVLRLLSDGTFQNVGQVRGPGALLGRSPEGNPLLLRWSGADLEWLELYRLIVQPATKGPP
ncbi:MAG TPA: hypothetical protein VGC13_14500 [Longimicrobium sp.]|uniref:hypothetical protein n=1 Tax=Longimicrobium sp. TaxID=2029185 RepID=UPI002ED835BE